MQVREHVAKVAELRRKIREADDRVSDWELRDLWDQAQFELGKVRLFGDLVLAAFFEEEKPKDRERKLAVFLCAVGQPLPRARPPAVPARRDRGASSLTRG